MTNKQFEINTYIESSSLFEEIYNKVENMFPEQDDFLILDETTKEEFAKERVQETLWAFETSFVMNHLKLEIVQDLGGGNGYQELKKAIQDAQENLCESANTLIKTLTNWENMIEEALEIDGYGHFLNGYDGEEHELEISGNTYFVYYNN